MPYRGIMKEQKTALVLVIDGVEEIEAVTAIDLLRRAGVHVTVTATSGSLIVRGRNGIEIKADALLSDHSPMEVDLLVIPGGPGHQAMARQESVLEILRDHHEREGWIGSICAGPVVLEAAGVLGGRRYTSFPATAEQLPERIPDEPVVVDGKLITSQGAGTAYLFALRLVECLCGPEKAGEIAASTCFPA